MRMGPEKSKHTLQMSSSSSPTTSSPLPLRGRSPTLLRESYSSVVYVSGASCYPPHARPPPPLAQRSCCAMIALILTSYDAAASPCRASSPVEMTKWPPRCRSPSPPPLPPPPSLLSREAVTEHPRRAWIDRSPRTSARAFAHSADPLSSAIQQQAVVMQQPASREEPHASSGASSESARAGWQPLLPSPSPSPSPSPAPSLSPSPSLSGLQAQHQPVPRPRLRNHPLHRSMCASRRRRKKS